MRVTCENIHVRNLANFDALLAKIVGYGSYYKPTKSSIQLEALALVSQNAKLAIAHVDLLTYHYTHSVNLREVAFESLKIMNQKIYKALQSVLNISETEMYMLVGASNPIGSSPTSQGIQVISDYLSIYKKWPAPDAALKQQRQDFIAATGFRPPLEWL